MKSKIFLFLLLTAAVVISSCSNPQSKADSTLQSIPNDVSMVTTIDPGAILEKADFENVKTMAFYKELIEETKRYNSTLAEVLANPSQSGVDLSKNIYIAHHLDQNNPEEMFVATVASVKDKAALETLINSNSKLKTKKMGNFTIASSGSQSVAWNDEKVVIGMTNSYNDPTANLEKFFNTTEENSIAIDANLKKAMSGNHDITSWMSSNALASSPTLKSGLTMGGIPAEAAEDNFIHSYVDFNNGAIESRSDMYLQDALVEDINLLFKDKVSTDFSSYIPANANSVMTIALDLEGAESVINKKGALMMANFGLKEYGLTVEDIVKTFGGDILVFSTPGSKDTPKASFATSIVDKSRLDKFLSLAVEFNAFKKLDNNLYSINSTAMLSGEGFNGQDAQLLIQDDMLIISADPGIISKISAGGYNGSDKIASAKIKSLKGNIFAGFADFNNLINASGGKDLDLNFKDLNYTTNRKKGTFNLNFKDKNSNGLKQLFESINEIYLADKKGAI